MATTTHEYRIEKCEGWPYPRAEVIRRERQRIWLEVSEEVADEMLGAVPPAEYTDNGFVVGEEAAYGPLGPIHAVFHRVGSRWFMAEMAKAERDSFVSGLITAL